MKPANRQRCMVAIPAACITLADEVTFENKPFAPAYAAGAFFTLVCKTLPCTGCQKTQKGASQTMRTVFTSESVTEGHPDKLCDQVSDAILDAILAEDPNARVACESFATTGIVGVLRGGGDVRIAMLIDVLPLWCFTLPLLVLLGLVLHAPIAIFCFIMATESALKVPFGLHRIRGGKWIHDVTQDLNA